MFDEDGRKIDIVSFPRNMEGMSVEELEKYIIDLQSEIKRAKEDIEKKKAHQDAASQLFS